MEKDNWSLEEDRSHIGDTSYRPQTEKELRVHRMQHLMSLRGRATKSDDPEIVRHAKRIKTTSQFGSCAFDRWGERVRSEETA